MHVIATRVIDALTRQHTDTRRMTLAFASRWRRATYGDGRVLIRSGRTPIGSLSLAANAH